MSKHIVGYKINNFIFIYFRRKPRPRHRQRDYVQQIVSLFRPDEFKIFFRMSRISVQCLQDWICSVCTDGNITGITDRERSGGSKQKPLGERLLMLLLVYGKLGQILINS